MKKTVKKHKNIQFVNFDSSDKLQLLTQNDTKKMIVLDLGVFFLRLRSQHPIYHENTTNFSAD